MFQFPHLPPSIEGPSPSREGGCPIRISTDRPASGSPWLFAALPRPSSALVAKASTIRPFSLVTTLSLLFSLQRSRPPTSEHVRSVRLPAARLERADSTSTFAAHNRSFFFLAKLNSHMKVISHLHNALLLVTHCNYSLVKVDTPAFA